MMSTNTRHNASVTVSIDDGNVVVTVGGDFEMHLAPVQAVKLGATLMAEGHKVKAIVNAAVPAAVLDFEPRDEGE